LRESHLMPKALYKLMRAPERANPNPVFIVRGKAGTTSRQVSDKLLCHDCELRFSRHGEQEALRLCYRHESGFLLRDTIAPWAPAVCANEYTAFIVPPAHVHKAHALTFFAASVFWRSAVHRWMVLGEPREPTELGKYEKAFRVFLLGEAPFPECAVLFVSVAESANPDNVVALPVVSRRGSFHRHKFHIPGIIFVLLVGRGVPAAYASLSLTAPEPMLYTGDFRNDDWFRGMLEDAGRAIRVGVSGGVHI